MPDHLHLLAQTPPGTDFSRFVIFFKQSSGIALRQVLGTSDSIWQPRFYDHGLRSDEGFLAAAEYVLNNPVRGGLVADAGEYPYSGSLEWPHLFERNSGVETVPEVTSEPEGTELHAIRAQRARG